MEAASLSVFVFLTWVIHGAVSGVYSKRFASTRSLGFRAVHAIEIFTLTLIMMLAYKAVTDSEPAISLSIGVALAVLMILDGAVMYFSRTVRNTFDVLHFVTAYLSVTAAIILSLAA